MHIFDYNFLKNGLLPAEIVNLTAAVTAFNAISNERYENNKKVYSELTEMAIIQSVKASNAIEGIVTTDARIREIVAGNTAPLNHSEAEIAGYRDALNEIHMTGSRMAFSEDVIEHLYSVMLSHTTSPQAGYKTEDNSIIETDANGRRRVRFRPVSADDTADAMEQLVLAYMDAKDSPEINQLLLIPCVILDFLCIHPFPDGNGRMSRLLTLLLLYRNDFEIGKYISVEEQINNDRDYYYEALQDSSVGWHDNRNSYIPFMKNFLSVLYHCYKELDKRFSVTNGKKLTKKARIEQTVLNNVLPISKAEICELLPEVSPTTVEAVLSRMVKEGTVKKIGTARNTKYVNAKRIRS